MLVVETVAKIRRAYFVQGKSIKAICRELRVSRKVVRKVLRSEATEFRYERGEQPLPRIGPWQDALDQLLAANEAKPRRERLTLIRVFEALRGLGYEGGYDAVRRYARAWQRERAATSVGAFVPLSFAPGEAYQFDWSHEIVLINGTTVTVKVAHVRLCHSRMLFCPGLSARDAGDGVRRARPRVRLFQRRLHARHLRQHEDRGGDDLRRQGARTTTGASCRCAATIWSIRWPARRRRAGRRARSRTRSVWCGNASSRRACGSKPTMS